MEFDRYIMTMLNHNLSVGFGDLCEGVNCRAVDGLRWLRKERTQSPGARPNGEGVVKLLEEFEQ